MNIHREAHRFSKTICCASAVLTCAVPLLGVFFVTGCVTHPVAHVNVDRLFAQWNRPDSPGAAVVIVKEGSVVYEHGYGSANLEHRIPVTPQTRFDVASVAKQFTGLSVAMLMQQGKLSPEDDIHKYLPSVPDFGKRITIDNLVHHTSGLRDWPETLGLSMVDLEAPITLDMILEMVRRQRELDFPPGEQYQYSNTGYNLLAAVIGKVTGQSFRSWTDTNLFRPLGMKSTLVCDNAAEPIPRRADSYVPGDGGKFRRLDSQLSAQGSSSLFTTADDMGKWLVNFDTGRVGGKAAIEMMRQRGRLNNGAAVDYGFGVVLSEGRGKFVTHSGAWQGYRSAMMWIPEKRFGVAILSNAGNMECGRLAFRIAELYQAVAPAKRESPSTPSAAANSDPAAWDAFLGTYRLGPGWLLIITREGDHLMAQASREDKYRMIPISETNFFVEAYGAAVHFVPGKSGAVTNLLYRGINAPKLDLPVLGADRLAAYAGDFWSEELRDLTRLEIHDGKLATQLRSGAWIHFVPTGPDRFDAQEVNVALEFTRNDAAELAEVKVSATRVRHVRYTRVALPKASPHESNRDTRNLPLPPEQRPRD